MKPSLGTKSLRNALREYMMIILALFPFALMVNWIFVPQNVVGAGLTGICSIIYYATQGFFTDLFPEYGGSIPLWISSLTINTILLIIAALTVGWKFCVRTLVGALALAFWYRVIPMRSEPLIEDPVTACIVGGVIFGMSLGIVMLNNGSSGGTDIVAMIVNNYKDVSLGKVMVICDAVIIASSYFLPIPEQFYVEGMDIVDFKIKRILYGLCMTVSYTAALDWIMSRMRQSVQFFIFSLIPDQGTIGRGTVSDTHFSYAGGHFTLTSAGARNHIDSLFHCLAQNALQSGGQFKTIVQDRTVHIKSNQLNRSLFHNNSSLSSR